MKQYTESDLVSFGNFLLSGSRKSKYKSGKNRAERMARVNHSDLENWKWQGLDLAKLKLVTD